MAPKTLGDYNILKTLGQGSLGTLYLAEHKYIKRPFALKVFPEDLCSEKSFIKKYEEELQALSFVEHPHIVKMHNVSCSDGQYFFVMDCVVDKLGETTNLAQYLLEKRELLEESEIVKIMEQVAEALSFAHERKVGDVPLSHRGLKLNNILIGKSENELKIYLSDFGLNRIIGHQVLLARTFKAIAEAMSELSLHPAKSIQQSKLHDSFLQTYAFLAPEQKNVMNDKALDYKADIFAFGVLAYYLLLQEYPEGIFDLPSSKRKDLHLNWDALVLCCLRKDPEKRASSIHEAMQHLHNFHASGELKDKGADSDQLHFDGFYDTHKESKLLKPVIKPQEIIRPEYEPNPGAIFQTELVVAKYNPIAAEVKNAEPITTEMVIIPEGIWRRGSSKGARDETPYHQIKLSAFAIDIHPITNEQFVRFLEAMGGEKDSNNNDIIRLRESRIKRLAGKLMIESGYAKHPVVGVTWYGAVAYAKWVGKRLPTEAEWEIAAMGGLEGAIYPTGNDIERSQANFFSSDTTAVMSYPSNGYGLFDIAGNVYEWCQDWYGYNYYEASIQEPENPKGPHQGVYRVLRGGCWKSLKEDLRVAHRHRNNPGTMNGTYGFRCAADVS